MKKLIILQGPPACGKSTWTKEYMKDHENDTIVVSRDAIRHKMGPYSMEHEKEVTIKEEEQTLEAMSKGLDIINDATNLNPKYLPKWETMAKEYGYEVEYKQFYVPFKFAVQFDQNPDREHHVGKSVLKRFYKTYFKERYEDEMLKTINYPRVPENKDLPKAIICDLDGTLAWMQKRSPFDLSRVDEDLYDPRMLEVVHTFMKQGVYVLFVTGREGTDEAYEKTLSWIKKTLDKNIYHHPKMDGGYDMFSLYMRKKRDFRHDNESKEEIYLTQIKDAYDVICVFEDRDRVVEMWRKNGLLCCQVANEEGC